MTRDMYLEDDDRQGWRVELDGEEPPRPRTPWLSRPDVLRAWAWRAIIAYTIACTAGIVTLAVWAVTDMTR